MNENNEKELAAPNISPEEVIAIGMFLLSQRRETLGSFGSLRYQELEEAHENIDPR